MSEETRLPRVDSQIDTDSLHENFLRNFLRLLQTARIHADNNKLLMGSAHDFLEVTRQLAEFTDKITIQIAGERLYLQSEKVPFLNQNAVVLNQLVDFFENIGIPGLRFSAEVIDLPPDPLLSFIRLLIQVEHKDDSLPFLVNQCSERFKWVEILLQHQKLNDDSMERRERGLRTYSYALASLTEVTQKINSQQVVGVRKAVRVAQKMVDSILEDEPILMGLSTIRNYDDYTHTHSVNVAILSMCLGSRIGLSPQSMEKLGICGLFHDLGKVEIPLEILNKEGKLTTDEFEEIKKHSLNSVRQIIKLNASGDLKAKILLPPFEHHLKYDLTGYPQTSRSKPISLFGRILAIADVFDAITSPRKYRQTALSPDRAVQLMLKGAGTDFDPILLKVFINMLGPYPIGTLVELNTGQFAFVIGSESKAKFERLRPMVVLLKSDGKGGYNRGEEIDLAQRDPVTDAYRYEIAQSHNPAVFGLQAAEYII